MYSPNHFLVSCFPSGLKTDLDGFRASCMRFPKRDSNADPPVLEAHIPCQVTIVTTRLGNPDVHPITPPRPVAVHHISASGPFKALDRECGAMGNRRPLCAACCGWRLNRRQLLRVTIQIINNKRWPDKQRSLDTRLSEP